MCASQLVNKHQCKENFCALFHTCFPRLKWNKKAICSKLTPAWTMLTGSRHALWAAHPHGEAPGQRGAGGLFHQLKSLPPAGVPAPGVPPSGGVRRDEELALRQNNGTRCLKKTSEGGWVWVGWCMGGYASKKHPQMCTKYVGICVTYRKNMSKMCGK